MPYPDRPDPASSVLHWRDDAVAHVRFNRPRALNAIDLTMAGAFFTACQDIAADATVRAVCLSGEGRAFMAGGDIAAMQSDPVHVASGLIQGLHGGIRILADIDAPVVASVQGAVFGGGLGLVLSCDLVVSAQGTRFGVAYPMIGASCDCSTSWMLPRRVGFGKAMELALLADEVSADEALRLGLCNEVVPADELTPRTQALLQRLASGPTVAFGQMRRLMRASWHSDLSTQLDAEAAGFKAAAVTEDFASGVSAFLAKRPAVFSGR